MCPMRQSSQKQGVIVPESKEMALQIPGIRQ
jgi:hypothetical protein